MTIGFYSDCHFPKKDVYGSSSETDTACCELLSNFISLTDRKQQIKKFILSKYCGDPSFRNILSNLHNFR